MDGPVMVEPPTGDRDGSGGSRLLLDQLAVASRIAEGLIAGVRPEDWSAPTPCTDWDVRRLVEHLVGLNLVFVSMLTDQPPPRRVEDRLGSDPVRVYRDSAEALHASFAQPDVLDRTFGGPLGSATGAKRLQIRLYDLLAHTWDLGRATGQPVEVPEDLADQVLDFARGQLHSQDRGDRFGPVCPVADDAPAIDRLAAFLGRPTPSAQR